MFGTLILSVVAILAICIIILIGFCVYHYFNDPFDMSSDMEELKESLCKDSAMITEFKEIKSKMEDCPRITTEMPLIQVFNNNDKFYALVVGDANGNPRLFAYRRGECICISDYLILRDKKPIFKKQGLRHSISTDELGAILIEAEKKNFALELKEKQIWDIKRHFK